jgi:hypothetical protein
MRDGAIEISEALAHYDPLTAPHRGGQMEPWRILASVVVCLAVSLLGVALATNFRGVTEWHVRRSMATASVLRRVPPWRWLPDASYDQRVARFALMERAIGMVFAGGGVMFLIVLGYAILSGEPITSSR